MVEAQTGADAGSPDDPALEELRGAYDAGNLVLFAGAGISAAAGLPSGERLAEQALDLARARGLRPEAQHEMEELIGRHRFVDALTAAREALGGPEFVALVKRAFDDNKLSVPEAAEAIAALAPGLRAVLTTNIDRLLERALKGQWPVLDRAPPDIAQRRGFLLKLHGTRDDASSWVFTREDYDRALHADPQLKQAFSTLFNACHLLFAGYDLDGDDFEAVLSRVRAFAGDQPPRHFALVPSDTVKPHRRTMLERSGVRVIPYADRSANHSELVRILRALGRPAQAPEGAAAMASTTPCPFPGLAPFDESLAAAFVGRDKEIAEILKKLNSPTGGHGPRRWLQIEGPSGSGKSSFARAGLVPAIKNGRLDGAPNTFCAAAFRPGRDPVLNLAHALGIALSQASLDLDGIADALRYSSSALSDLLREHTPPDHGVLLVVDQLEEAFTLAAPEPRRAFDAALAHAVGNSGPPFCLITTIRSDFVGHFSELPALEQHLNSDATRYHLPTISAAGLRDAIEKPAKLARLTWEPALLERLLQDAAASPESLPLVAHTLRSLWDKRSGNLLTMAAYEALGGVAGALARSADAILSGLGPDGRERAKRLLLGLVKIGRGTEDTRQAIPRREALQRAGGGEAAQHVLTRLSGGRDFRQSAAQARLVVVSRRGEEDQVDLIHEALLRQWDTLRGWVHENRTALERRDDLEGAARTWAAAGCPVDDLPTGAQLEYLRGAEVPSDLARRFLEAAAALEQREQLERERDRRRLEEERNEAQRQREEAQRQKAIAESRLQNAIDGCDHLILVIERKIEPLPGAATIRKELLERTAELQDRLLEAAGDSKEALHSRMTNHLRRGDLARTHEHLTRAAQEYQAALDIAQRLGESEPENPQYRQGLATCYTNLGDLAMARGDLSGARRLFEQGFSLRKALADASPEDAMLRHELFGTYKRLGDVSGKANALEAARAFYQQALALVESRAEANPEEPLIGRDLSDAHKRLGQVASEKGDLATALQLYAKALQVNTRLLKAHPWNTLLRDDASKLYDHLGRVIQSRGNLAGARELFERSLHIRETLSREDPENAVLRQVLAQSCHNLGAMLRIRGDLAAAREMIERALQIRESLTQADPNNQALRSGLSKSQCELGDLYKASGDLSAAKDYFLKALEIDESLAAADPENTTLRSDLAVSYERYGEVLKESGDLSGAKTVTEKSLQILQSLTLADPENAALRADLATSHSRLGHLLASSGDLATARGFLEESVRIRESLALADPENAELRWQLSTSYGGLGELLRAGGDLAAARSFVEKSVQICEFLSQADLENAMLRAALAGSYARLGELARAGGDLPAARGFFEKSLEINEPLARTDPENTELQYALIHNYGNLGLVAQESGDLGLARAIYRKGIDFNESLANGDPKNTWLRWMMSTYHLYLGMLAARENDFDAARRLCDHALAIIQALTETDPARVDWQLRRVLCHLARADLARTTNDVTCLQTHRDAARLLFDRIEQEGRAGEHTEFAQCRNWLDRFKD